MADIVIIDYGMGNVHSVFKALDKIADKRSHVKISNSLEEIKKSSHIVCLEMIQIQFKSQI